MSSSSVFTCHANNSISNSSHRFNIELVKPPIFLKDVNINETTIRFNVHGEFVLNCTVDAHPKPDILWFKDGKKIINPAIDQMNLRIYNATAAAHFYACEIENQYGKLQRIFKTRFNPFWSKWSKWGPCTVECGRGKRKKMRKCHKVPHDSKNCIGKSVEYEICVPCFGKWTPWSDWSHCSTTCGTGQIHRSRQCIGDDCIGPNFEFATCFRQSCPDSRATVDLSKYLPISITYSDQVTIPKSKPTKINRNRFTTRKRERIIQKNRDI